MQIERTFNDAVIAEVRAELARRGTTHADFAKTCDWAPMYFSRRMSGKVPFSTDEIEKIADSLEIPVTQLTMPRQAAAS